MGSSEINIGLWTEIGEGEERHKLTATPQDVLGLTGAHVWRSSVEGGTAEYYDSVTVPTEEVLQKFLITDPAELHNGWDQPHWTDIHATIVRNDADTPVNADYWPFHKPLVTPESGPTLEDNSTNYARILQGLSKTVLGIVEH
jgi:hypothetical protein